MNDILEILQQCKLQESHHHHEQSLKEIHDGSMTIAQQRIKIQEGRFISDLLVEGSWLYQSPNDGYMCH